jgi:hypothetical protein
MINQEWHEAHRIPKNPTLDQRIEWHLEHSQHCNCRPIAGKLLEEMTRRGIPVPAKPDARS